MVQVGVNNWLLGQFRAHIWRKLGSKSGSWAILGAKKTQEAGKAPPRDSRPAPTVIPVTRFGQKFSIFTSVLGSHFGSFFESFLNQFFETLLGRLRGRSGAHFGAQKRSKRSPKRSPRAAKTSAQLKTQPKQKLAFRLGGSSLFGSWSGPRRGSAEAQDAILQAKNLLKRGSKRGPEKRHKK